MKCFDKFRQALKQAQFEFELNYLNEVKEFCKSSPFKIDFLRLNIGHYNDEGQFIKHFYISNINVIWLSDPNERGDSYESFFDEDQCLDKNFITENNIKFIICLEEFLKQNYSILNYNEIWAINIDLNKFTLRYEK